MSLNLPLGPVMADVAGLELNADDIYRLQHPLTGSTTWADYDGTSVVRAIWAGKANTVELEVDGPAGHIEGLSLRL